MKKRLNRVNVVVLLALFLVAGMNAQVSEGTSQDIVKAVKSGVAINFRITSYNVCYTKLLR